MKIVVFVNPMSRANRKNPGIIAELRDALGAAGTIHCPRGLDALAADVRRLGDEKPDVVGVHGGDGTLHKVLTLLLETWPGDRPLPAIAILPGGTMNVVSSSLGLRADPTAMLRGLRTAVSRGEAPATLERSCMKIGDRYGFVFANGAIAHFLEHYYASGAYGPGKAVWLAARLLVSTPLHGPYARAINRPFRGRVLVDGLELPWRTITSISAATVREVGLGYKLNHRADEDPTRLAMLAIHTSPFGMVLGSKSVFEGRGLSPDRASSYLAREVLIEPEEPPMPFTVDGDIYREAGPLRLAMGPAVRFVRPHA